MDISENAKLAQSFVEGYDLPRFKADKRTVYAVTRCLEIISEATRKLPAGMKHCHPLIAWKDIAGAGNVYRHDYEDVSSAMVWNTVAVLGPLIAVVEAELAALKGKVVG